MNFKSDKIQVLLFFVFISFVILFRSNVDKLHYCTPDSRHYLDVSRSILEGKGANAPIISEADSIKNNLADPNWNYPKDYPNSYFATWPLAYPIAISTIAYISNTSALWGSKICNIILLALSFYLIFILFGNSYTLPIFYFGSYSMLEICTYTWSENLFIPLFLLFIIALKRINELHKSSLGTITILTFSLICLSLTRYASIIYYVSATIIMIYFASKSQFQKSKIILISLIISSLLLLGYLYLNYTQTGYLTGIPRSGTQIINALTLIKKLGLGLLNQLSIVKPLSFNSNIDLILTIGSLLIQGALMVYIFKCIRKSLFNLQSENSIIFLVFNGIIYLIFIILLTFQSTIDPFDYRTLMPFSFPLIIGFLNLLEKNLNEQHQTKTVLVLKAFFIFSVMMNLPKQYLLSVLK